MPKQLPRTIAEWNKFVQGMIVAIDGENHLAGGPPEYILGIGAAQEALARYLEGYGFVQGEEMTDEQLLLPPE